MVKSAGHACYLDKPHAGHYCLKEILTTVWFFQTLLPHAIVEGLLGELPKPRTRWNVATQRLIKEKYSLERVVTTTKPRGIARWALSWHHDARMVRRSSSFDLLLPCSCFSRMTQMDWTSSVSCLRRRRWQAAPAYLCIGHKLLCLCRWTWSVCRFGFRICQTENAL